ncbi:MAG: FUN14 domain-containing protein [Candidatus Bathyarchaeia archaeon]
MVVVRLNADYINPLIAQLGFGGSVGFIVGFALKKIMKIFIVLVGVFFVALQYLAYIGFIEIKYEKFAEAAEGWLATFQGELSALSILAANIPFVGSFIVGLALGLKTG